MGKFYAVSILLVIVGAAGYASPFAFKAAEWQPVVSFLSIAIVLTGLACFVLTFGYHVRKTAMGSGTKLD